MCSTPASAARQDEESSIEALINEVFEGSSAPEQAPAYAPATVAASAVAAPPPAPPGYVETAAPTVAMPFTPPPPPAPVFAAPAPAPAPVTAPAYVAASVATSAPARFTAPMPDVAARFTMPAPAVGPIDDILAGEPPAASVALALGHPEPAEEVSTGFYDPEDHAIPREPDLFLGGGGHRKRRFF